LGIFYRVILLPLPSFAAKMMASPPDGTAGGVLTTVPLTIHPATLRLNLDCSAPLLAIRAPRNKLFLGARRTDIYCRKPPWKICLGPG
jgi:hypothetical protein